VLEDDVLVDNYAMRFHADHEARATTAAGG
jgi:hypothetical protein